MTKFFEKTDAFSASFGAPMPERSYRLVMKKGPNYGTNPTDVYPAYVNGMEPAVNIASESVIYRNGYNKGSEKDNEIGGEGNTISTFYRELDTRLGRWWAIDPKISPWESPYLTMSNNPIAYSDIMGDKIIYDKENTSKAERREIRKEIRALRKDASFNFAYKQLKKSDQTYTITSKPIVDKDGLAIPASGVFDSSDKTINIAKLGDQGTISTIAEETFHAFQYEFYGKEKFNDLSSSTYPSYQVQVSKIQNKNYIASRIKFCGRSSDSLLTL